MARKRDDAEPAAPALVLSAVDLDGLPALGDLFDGNMRVIFERELRHVVRNLLDTTIEHEEERTLTFAVGFLPDADLQSAQYRIATLKTGLPSGVLPRASRVVFRRRGSSLSAHLRASVGQEPLDPGHDVPVKVSVPSLDSFGLDDAWRRELVRVLLNIDDPRCEPQFERLITLQLALRADADRAAITCKAKRIQARLASTRAPAVGTLYVDQDGPEISVSFDPVGLLPDDAGGVRRARQDRITTTATKAAN